MSPAERDRLNPKDSSEHILGFYWNETVHCSVSRKKSDCNVKEAVTGTMFRASLLLLGTINE